MAKTINLSDGLCALEVALIGAGFKKIIANTFTHAQSGNTEEESLYFNGKINVGVEILHTHGSACIMRVEQGPVARQIKTDPMTARMRSFYTNPDMTLALVNEIANLAPLPKFINKTPEA